VLFILFFRGDNFTEIAAHVEMHQSGINRQKFLPDFTSIDDGREIVEGSFDRLSDEAK